MANLTGKQKIFCEEYVANNFNATKAYMVAYQCEYENARTNASKRFKKPHINADITEIQKERLENLHVNAERVATKLTEIAFAEKGDEYYGSAAQLKALDLLQKQLGLQTQKVEAEVKETVITVSIEDED